MPCDVVAAAAAALGLHNLHDGRAVDAQPAGVPVRGVFGGSRSPQSAEGRGLVPVPGLAHFRRRRLHAKREPTPTAEKVGLTPIGAVLTVARLVGNMEARLDVAGVVTLDTGVTHMDGIPHAHLLVVFRFFLIFRCRICQHGQEYNNLPRRARAALYAP